MAHGNSEYADYEPIYENISKYSKSAGKTFGDVNTQLESLGRFIVDVPPDGNCLFESVARQVQNERLKSAQVLRNLVYDAARVNADMYKEFLAGDEEQYLQELELLKIDGTWNMEVGDLAITILADILRVKIVIISGFYPPQIFPDDGNPIDDHAIVIVQDSTQSHYDATKLLSEETIADKLKRLGRQLVEVPVNGNSFFEAIAEQLDDPIFDAHYLRGIAANQGMANMDKYIHSSMSLPTNISKWKTEILDFKNDRHWKASKTADIIQMLSDALGMNIAVLRNETPSLLVYGSDDEGIGINTILVVEISQNPPEYHASRHHGPKYGTAKRQVALLERKIVEMPNDENSFFRSVATQLNEPALGGRYLRQLVYFHCKDRLHRYIKYYTSDRMDKFRNHLEFIKMDLSWSYEMTFVVAQALADALNVKVVIVRDHSQPVELPYDGKPIDKSAVVIVEDEKGSHFDSTRSLGIYETIPGEDAATENQDNAFSFLEDTRSERIGMLETDTLQHFETNPWYNLEEENIYHELKRPKKNFLKKTKSFKTLLKPIGQQLNWKKKQRPKSEVNLSAPLHSRALNSSFETMRKMFSALTSRKQRGKKQEDIEPYAVYEPHSSDDDPDE